MQIYVSGTRDKLIETLETALRQVKDTPVPDGPNGSVSVQIYADITNEFGPPDITITFTDEDCYEQDGKPRERYEDKIAIEMED